jgi:hypothetical protein
MISLLLGFTVLMVAGLGLVFHVAHRAPVGHEDEAGFHFGPNQHEPAKDFHGALPAFSR